MSGARESGPCAHGDPCSPWGERSSSSDTHAATGRFVYSDGSSHPCCEVDARRLRGVGHGPGRFVPNGGPP